MKTIRRFDVLSVMRLAGVIYGFLGIVLGVFFLIFAGLGLLVGRDQTDAPFAGPLGFVLAIVLAVVFPVVYGIIGALGAGLMSVIYNIASKRFGGIRVDVDDTPTEAALSVPLSN